MAATNGAETAKCPLKVLIVGAGPAGLAAAWYLAKKGHSVIVLEKKAALNFGGGDLQLSPNGTHCIRSIGLEPHIRPICQIKTHFAFQTWHSMKTFAKSPVDMSGEFPSMMCRRDDLQKALNDCALEAGAEILFNKEVTHLDEDQPSVTTADGTKLTADLIVAADGVRSPLRKLMYPDRDTKPSITKQVCFHYSVPHKLLEEDPETKILLENNDSCNIMMAENSYLVSWSLNTREEYYMIFSELEYNKPAEVGAWNTPADINEVRQLYNHYPQAVRKALQKVESCEKWRLVDSIKGVEWVSRSGKVLLISDGQHGMLPHAAQGCTQGLEDVAALGQFLDQVRTPADIPTLTRAYAQFREPRTSKIQQAASNNIHGFTVADGPVQEARDASFGSMTFDQAAVDAWNNAPLDPNASFNDRNFQKWITSYSVVDRARESAKACMASNGVTNGV